MRRTLVAFALVATLARAACSGGGDDEPTPTDAAPAPSPPTTLDKGSATPEPDATPTPRATAGSVVGFPDGPLLALSPASGATVTSQAVLVRGTIESGAVATVNGVEMDPDLSGDFFVAVAVGPGINSIIVEVTGADGPWYGRSCRSPAPDNADACQMPPPEDVGVWRFVTGDIAAFTRGLKREEGADLWLVGGGQINTVMLNAGLIDEIIVTLVPIVLGAGIPLFAPGASTTGFRTVSSQTYANGMIQWAMTRG